MSGDDLSGFSMLDLFKAEVEQHTQAMNTGLVGLEEAPDDVARIEPLMRGAHSIKGAARIVGLDAAVELAHVMEDCFVAAQEKRIRLVSTGIDLLLQGVDWLDRIAHVTEPDMPGWIAENRQEMQRLVWQLQLVHAGKAPVSERPVSERPEPRREAPQAPAPTPARAQEKPDTPNGPGAEKPTQTEPAGPDPVPSSESASASTASSSAPGPSSGDLGGFSMMDLFKAEVEQHSQALNQGLIGLEESPDDAARIEPLMRAAHSIKGAARIVGLDAAVGLAHVMEDCFVAAQEKRVRLTPGAIDALLQGVDLLEQVSRMSETELPQWLAGNADAWEKLLRVLGDIREGRAAPAPAAEKSAPGIEAAPPVVSPVSPAVPAQAAADAAPDGVAAAQPVPSANTERAKPSSQSAPPLAEPGDDRVVRVSAENLNRLMGLAGESLVDTRRFRPLIESLLLVKRQQNRLAGVLDALQDAVESRTPYDALDAIARDAIALQKLSRQELLQQLERIEGFARRSDDLTSRLYNEVIASRMRPFSDGVGGFPRTVRDLARKLEKKVRFEVKGEKTQVDRDILEKIEAPINHMIRNAIDHAIEPPDVRVANGKPETGTITVEARHWAGMLTVTISDDGKGIDPESIRRKVVQKKMVPDDVAASLSDAELFEFMFLPGFSTAQKVSEVSGRGVGLDVVQNFVQQVSGTIRVSSELGAGTTFTLTLPITLSVIRAVVVEIAGEPYAFPMTRIDRIEHIGIDEVTRVENRQSYSRDGVNIGLVPGAQVLGFEAPIPTDGQLCVVVVSDKAQPYGLVVDRFVGEQDLVVRKLDPRLAKVPDIAAASLMEDGSPLLIIDTDDLLRSIDKLLHGGRLGAVKTALAQSLARRKRVLVVDDSITVREVERKLLENKGYQVEIAVDGVDGWNAVRDSRFDLVITDVDMPRMTGIELVQAIKAEPRLRDIPVMIVSYKDREEDRLRGLEAGANAYLTKGSFHDQTLINMVRDLIGEPEEAT